MPWCVAWCSRRGRTGRGPAWFTREKAEQLCAEFNAEYNPEVIYKAVEVLPADEWMTSQTQEEADTNYAAYQDEKAVPDRKSNRSDRRTLEKPPAHRVNYPNANSDDQNHQQLVNKPIAVSKVNRRGQKRQPKFDK